MRKILSVILMVLFIGNAIATPPDWRSIRPSVFLVLKSSSLSAAHTSFDNLVQVMHVSTKCLSGREKPAIPEFVEDIVLIEEDAEWLVAFFPRGNGRIAATIKGVVHTDSVTRLNPEVIKVSKTTLRAEKCKSPVALPWPVAIPIGLNVFYSESTLAEKAEVGGELPKDVPKEANDDACVGT